MSVGTVFMPNMHKRFRCISPRVNNWFLAFGLFEGNAKHLPRTWHTVSLRRLELSVQGCLTNTVVQDGDPCEQALQRCIQMCEWSTLWAGKPNYFYFTAIVHLHKYICGYYFITLQILHTHTVPLTCDILALAVSVSASHFFKCWRSNLQIACHIVTALLHLFFMASFSWMLVEGLLLWSKVVSVNISEDSRMKLYYIIGWGNVAFFFYQVCKVCPFTSRKKKNNIPSSAVQLVLLKKEGKII